MSSEDKFETGVERARIPREVYSAKWKQRETHLLFLFLFSEYFLWIGFEKNIYMAFHLGWDESAASGKYIIGAFVFIFYCWPLLLIIYPCKFRTSYYSPSAATLISFYFCCQCQGFHLFIYLLWVLSLSNINVAQSWSYLCQHFIFCSTIHLQSYGSPVLWKLNKMKHSF